VDWVLNQTVAQTALDNWCREVKGGLYNLDNLIMNAGAAWNDTRVCHHWSLTTRPRAILLPAHWSPGPSCYSLRHHHCYHCRHGLLLDGTHHTRPFRRWANAQPSTPRPSKGAHRTHSLARCVKQHTKLAARETDGTWTREWCSGPVLGQEGTGLVRVGGLYERSEPLTAETESRAAGPKYFVCWQYPLL
jgi:hypothetical protein